MEQTNFSAPKHFFRPSRSHAVVVGGGTMGADVAVVLCRGGCKTTVIESNPERGAKVPELVLNGLTQLGATQHQDKLSVAASLNDIDWNSVDLVIECIPERLDIKQALFAQLEQHARKDALLASNSSSFPITAIAEGDRKSVV